MFVPHWRALGLHWWGYQRSGMDLADPSAGRAARLAGEMAQRLDTPVQAAIWLADCVVELDGSVYVWNADNHRSEYLCPVGRSAAIRTEVAYRTTRGWSMHVSTRSKWGNHTLALEAVDRVQCPDSRCPAHGGIGPAVPARNVR
jgi:hypothetical protein